MTSVTGLGPAPPSLSCVTVGRPPRFPTWEMGDGAFPPRRVAPRSFWETSVKRREWGPTYSEHHVNVCAYPCPCHRVIRSAETHRDVQRPSPHTHAEPDTGVPRGRFWQVWELMLGRRFPYSHCSVGFSVLCAFVTLKTSTKFFFFSKED